MKKTLMIMAVAAVALFGSAACEIEDTGSSAESEYLPAEEGKGSTPRVSKRVRWGDGMYKVPGEIKPGTYMTKSKGALDSGCYWERLNGAGGQPQDIIANGTTSGPERITVKKSDKYVKFSLGCVWQREQ